MTLGKSTPWSTTSRRTHSLNGDASLRRESESTAECSKHTGCEAAMRRGMMTGFQTDKNGIVKTRILKTRPYGTKA